MRRAWWAVALVAVALGGCGRADDPGASDPRAGDPRASAERAGDPRTGDTTGGSATPTGRTPTGRWQEPARYSFTLDSRCGEQALIGRFQITVDNGDVSRVTGLDEQARAALQGGRRDFVPTLRELLDQVDSARSSGADVATASFDPADGHPTNLDIDPELNTVDDESCYEVSDYRPNA
jgi:hypothetical protein